MQDTVLPAMVAGNVILDMRDATYLDFTALR
jgi:hypothetical protein